MIQFLFAVILLYLSPIQDYLVNAKICDTTNSFCALGLGSFIVIVIVTLLATVSDGIIRLFSIGKIKLVPEENIRQLIHTGEFLGSSFGAGIKVINNNGFSISDCMTTIVQKEQLVYQNGSLVPSPNSNAFFGLSPLGNLTWNRYGNEQCKIDIHAKSSENIILVANMIIGVRLKEPQKQEDMNPIQVFNFALCPHNPMQITDTGLYKIKIRFNGKKKDEELVEHFDGYIFSAFVPSDDLAIPSQRIYIHIFTGNPMKDPLVQKFFLRGTIKIATSSNASKSA